MTNPYHWLLIKPELFYGEDRVNLIREMFSGLLQGDSFALVGGRRMGKTTFLRRLEHELKIAHYLDTSYFDIQSMPACVDPNGVFMWLAGETNISSGINGIEAIKKYMLEKGRKGFFKVVWLIDEFDAFREFPWCSVFFNNLRALLHNTPGVSGNLVVVIAGSRMIQLLRDSPGSPLANVLRWKTLTLLNQKDTQQLVNEPTQNRFPAALGNKIWEKTGGHPFLIQFLMYHILCSMQEYSAQEQWSYEKALESAEQRLITEHDLVFRQWWYDHLSEEERNVFRSLERHCTLTIDQIVERTGLGRGQVLEALLPLQYIGLVRKEGNGYAVAGAVIHEWVKEHDILVRGIHSSGVVPTASLHELFDELEECIRTFVTDNLRKIGQLNSLPKIFSDQISKAQTTYAKQECTSENCPLDRILWYSDFDFPFLVMLRFWKHFYNSFHQVSRDKIFGKNIDKAKQRFVERMEVLTKIRNTLRHSRSVTEDEKNKAKVFCRDILACIQR